MYAGKFAQICQTTKDTLRHYDEIGLLKPASINANGYKIYSASQIIDFLAISSLQEAGCSLEEIKRSQKQHDPKMTLQLFTNKKVEIEETAREIEKKRQLIESAIASLQTQEKWESGKPTDPTGWRLVEEEETYLLTTKIPLQSDSPEELFLKIADHEKLSKESENKRTLPNLYKVGKTAFLENNCGSDFNLCTEVSSSEAKNGKCERRAAGLRFQSMHHLSFNKADNPTFQEDNPLFALLNNTKSLLADNKLEVYGDILIRETCTHVSPELHEVQIVIDIPVEYKGEQVALRDQLFLSL